MNITKLKTLKYIQRHRPVVLHDYKLSTVTRPMEKMSYVFLFAFFPTTARFRFDSHWHFSSFDAAFQVFHVFLPTKFVLCVFYLSL